MTVISDTTDPSSIIFSDETDILSGHDDPDLAYATYIRVSKTRLALFYIKHSSVLLDSKIVFATFVSIFSRSLALRMVPVFLHLSSLHLILFLCPEGVSLFSLSLENSCFTVEIYNLFLCLLIR